VEGGENSLGDLPVSLNQAVAVVILFVLSAFFSGSETALFSIPQYRIRKLREHRDHASHRIAVLLDNPNRLLVTLLTGNMIVNVLASATLGVMIERALHSAGLSEFAAFAIAAIGMTTVLLLFGEITPKVFALRDPERIAAMISVPVEFFIFLLSPVGRVLLSVSEFILTLTSLGRLKADPFVTEAELETAVSVGERAGVIHGEERKMIESIMEFTDTTVKEVMVPRTDIKVLRKGATVSEALGFIRETGFSRIPVYGETIDDIVGMLYAKDLVAFIENGDGEKPIDDLLREAYFVPETKNVADLLNEFRKKRVHCAIVVDEHGGTAGLVTLDDLVEEVVGEIHDERDIEEPLIEKVGPEGVVVDARTRLDALSQIIGHELRDEAHESVAGFVLGLAGHLPRKGERIRHCDMTFVVEEVSERRILKVRVIPAQSRTDSTDSPGR